MRLFLVAWLFLFSLHAVGAETLECGTSSLEGPQFKWCIQTPEHPNGDVLWYLHGAFHSERTWSEHKINKGIRAEWEKMGAGAPTVISISFGTLWFLQAENGLYPYYRDTIRPFLEGKLTFRPFFGRRLLMGYSMGGFNASQLLLRDGALFSRVVLESPAIVTASPFSPAEIRAYYDRNQPYISKLKAGGYFELLKSRFVSPENWALYNPLLLVQAGIPRGTEVYVSTGRSDEFGFHEGAELFASTASSQGGRVTWQSLEGGHGAHDPHAIALFLGAPSAW